MTLAELRYLVALAERRNFSRAADMCAISQPSLSVAIAKIESELGVQLFERGKGCVTPTEVGQRVVEQARVALHEADKVRQVAESGRDPLCGPLRLGVIQTVAPYLLPQVIPHLKRIAPRMPLIIEENLTLHLRTMIMQAELDAAIISLPFEAPGVVSLPLYDEPFVVIVPKGHPWEARAALSPQEIRGENLLLLKAGNCFRDQVLDICPEVSTPETDFRLGQSLATLHGMVSSGLGVSVIPASAVCGPFSTDLVSVIGFTTPEPSRRIALAYRKGFTRAKAIDAIIAAVAALHPAVTQNGDRSWYPTLRMDWNAA